MDPVDKIIFDHNKIQALVLMHLRQIQEEIAGLTEGYEIKQMIAFHIQRHERELE
jgi:hypothetical protein